MRTNELDFRTIWYFWKWKGAKLGITTPPCGHTMQVKDKTCSFNVIFYFEIILIIKSLSTVHACVPSVSPSVTRPGSSRGHVQVTRWWMEMRGEKDERRDAMTIHPVSVTAREGTIWWGGSIKCDVRPLRGEGISVRPQVSSNSGKFDFI